MSFRKFGAGDVTGQDNPEHNEQTVAQTEPQPQPEPEPDPQPAPTDDEDSVHQG